MTRLLFIYPLLDSQDQVFRYVQTARRLFNEKVAVQILTIGKKRRAPIELQGIPLQHIEVDLDGLRGLWQFTVQRKIWRTLKELSSSNFTIFMNGLDLPIVFWASKRLQIPLIAQFPENQCYSNIYKKLLGQLGKSLQICLLYGSQVHADSCRIEGFDQHVISMPLQPELVESARQFRASGLKPGAQPFSVLIACRSASLAIIQKIQFLVHQCKGLHFHCWFFQADHLQKALHVFDDHPNVDCVYTRQGTPLYKSSHLYIELEEPQFIESHLPHLHYIREAMEFGLPAMLFQQGLGQEWVKQGVNGYLLESGQLREMISKVKLLAHSRLLYDRLSYNAVKIAQQWHPPNTCKALANLFLGGKMKCTYKTGLKPADNPTT